MKLLPDGLFYRRLMVVLLIVWAAVLIVGFILGPLNQARTNRIPLANRITSSFILVLCALLWWSVEVRTAAPSGYAALLMPGMVSGFVGDLIMSQLIPTPDRVIFGIAAFGVGHVFYIAAYLCLSGLSGLSDRRTRATALIALLVMGLVAWWGLVRSPQAPTVLNAGSLGYALLMGVMVGLAAALAVQERRFIPLAAGAGLFMISDLILGNYLFRGNKWLLVGDVVWITYIVGQALIVFSPAAALQVLSSNE